MGKRTNISYTLFTVNLFVVYLSVDLYTFR